jgi:hypothetical protein
MASIAVFVALGGISYAATSINGNKLIKGTVGAGKLRPGTLTSTQVKPSSLTGAVIDESSLSTVPAATTATTAATATTATSADSAVSAQNADTVDGLTAQDLQVTCRAATELFGGMCWDDNPRPIKNWIAASKDCGDAGGRLPTLSELVAYTLREGTQVVGEHWSGEVSGITLGNEEVVLTRTEAVSSTNGSLGTSLGYRCLFYRAN